MGINSSVESADAFSADSFLLSSNSSPSTRAKNDMKQLVFPLPASHRGLANAVGENNCFLNVTVQALWHLGPFRTELQRLIDGNAGSVREMMRTALYSNSLDSPEAAAEGEGERDGELVTTPRLLEEVDSRSSTGLGLSGATSATSPDAQGTCSSDTVPCPVCPELPYTWSTIHTLSTNPDSNTIPISDAKGSYMWSSNQWTPQQ